jgi:intracellular sulfur oxidation DsrE/DsrF family protein
MNRQEHSSVSDEQLNAFIDDELEFEEKERVFEQLGQDDELNREAHELRQLRALMRHAYRSPPPASRPKARNGKPGGGLIKAVAAGLLLALGALTGWYGNDRFATGTPPAVLAAHEPGVQLDTAAAERDNLLLHLTSNDPARMEAALNYAEQVLAKHRQQQRDFRLEVVANDGGIELLRRDTSPFPQRIAALVSEYDNVSFLACANALRKLRERGVKVELLPGTRSDHTAIEEIIERLEGGWRYLKV